MDHNNILAVVLAGGKSKRFGRDKSQVKLGNKRLIDYILDEIKDSIKSYKNYEIINQDGAKVLIDPKATMFLLGSIMDYRQDKLSSRFVFDNPNEKSTCGCGESFSV